MTHLAQPSHGLGPEGFLDAFANALGDRIAGMAGGAAVDRRRDLIPRHRLFGSLRLLALAA
jgi:hypothetical protein